MLSKLKKLKLNKIAIISISILISLALCFGFFYAALINQEKQKMEVSVLEISPYTEELSIAGKEITQNYAVTTINGKKYINNLNTVKLLLKGTDENYSGNSLTASNIVVKVGGSVVTPKTKTLGSAQNITNGVQYELTLAGIPGNGVLTVEVDANTLTDKSQNKNILTKLNIPCDVVISKSMKHEWNIVQINGKWYNVDCSGADLLNSDRDCFFLKSDLFFRFLGYYNGISYSNEKAENVDLD